MNIECALLTGVGTLAGIYVGAIPGLSGTMAISLLVSLTFGWDTAPALALMLGVFVGVVYGGSRSAILLNIPGAPAAVATGFDGYPLAQKGLAGAAMGVATAQSFLGTLIGIGALALLAPPVSRLALSFHSVDYLLLALIGLLAAGSLGGTSLLKGALAAALGVFLGTVGMDPLTAVKRFTFGVTYLNGGVHFVVALIGLFGASEAFAQLAENASSAVRQKPGRILPPVKALMKTLPLTLRSALLGVLVGALPGAGGDIAALLAYSHAKHTTKHPETPFGEGAIEGVIAPETANNAAIGGALIPMLTLGIPGDAVTAILIGAMTMHGLQPGPGLLASSPELFSFIVICLLFASAFLLLFGLTGIRVFSKITEIPKAYLIPMILVLSAIGAYAIAGNMHDVYWMLLFAVLGFFLKRYGYPVGPVALGLILCPLLETNFVRGVKLNGSVLGLFLSVFSSPLSIALFALGAGLCLSRIAGVRRLAERIRNRKEHPKP